MRLIDADALIKEITEFRCVNCDRRKGMKKGKMTFVYEIGDVPCRACDVGDMIDVLDEAPTVAEDINVHSKWISVEDRLPGNEFVLVSVVTKNTGRRWATPTIGEIVHGKWFLETEGTIADNVGVTVTHWMPLPEQPND